MRNLQRITTLNQDWHSEITDNCLILDIYLTGSYCGGRKTIAEDGLLTLRRKKAGAAQDQEESRGGTETKTSGDSIFFSIFQFKTLIIPQGAILLWSWRARKKYIKLREQYNKRKSLTLTVV